MVRRVTPAQFAAMQRQAINKYNQEVRRYNQGVERQVRAQQQAVNTYNQKVRQHNQRLAQSINRYNQMVRDHNSRVRLQQQAARQKSLSFDVRYTKLNISTQALYEQLQRVEQQKGDSEALDRLIDLSEQESSNSLHVMEALAEAPVEDHASTEDDTGIIECLEAFSEDLCNRWKGAIYALNPSNPDAARHFCTSIREVFTQILEITADDQEVLEAVGNCEVTSHGKPTRRSKITYLLQRKGLDKTALKDFAHADIDNIIELFGLFNDATHGPAGKHEFSKLQAIKKRVMGGIMFLAALAA